MSSISGQIMEAQQTDNAVATNTEQQSGSTEPEVIELCSNAGNHKYQVVLSGPTEGVYYLPSENNPDKKQFLCSLLMINAMVRDSNSAGWGRMLEFKDHDGKTHHHEMSAATVGKDESTIVGELRGRGVSVTASRKFHCYLTDYVLNTEPRDRQRIRSAKRTGWQEPGTYLMNDGTVIGESAEKYVFQSFSTVHPCSRNGTQEEWRTNVSALCTGNSRLIFAVSTAFASVLLNHMNVEGGGFHYFGRSSDGKTTALHVAASVIGKPREYIQTWRATDNGLEGIAKLHNDSLLILDELGEMNPHDAGKCAYLLANGSGKIRSMTSGDAKKKAEWLLYYLSSGEITLAEHMLEAGKTARAGQEIRHVDIPANAGAGKGLFENIHGYENAGQFADALRKLSAESYGHALPDFIKAFIDHREDVDEVISLYKNTFIERYLGDDACSQVGRVAGKFAVVAAAGMLASAWGITGWDIDHVSEAVGKVYCDWLTNRAHSGNQEDIRIITQIRGYLQLYGEFRFAASKYNKTGVLEIIETNRNLTRREGFKVVKEEGNEFYILPEAFKEICKGLNMSTTVKFLAENGYIVKAPDGRNQPQKRLPTIGQTRVYHLTSKIMQDNEETVVTAATGPAN
ncbi:MAG: DUF927 domain-containing protein [Geobacteraceae bacterium]|nr:DUF927 domain-containing protein [Geobacteraceae bacterium]